MLVDRTDAASLRVEASSSREWSRGDVVAVDLPLPAPDELFGEPMLVREFVDLELRQLR